MEEPRGRLREFSDEQLRQDLAAGLKVREIAAKYGVARQSVYERIDRLDLVTLAAAVAPEESRRFVSRQVDAMEELSRGLARVNRLQDACDEWLRDPDDPDRYTIGARSDEITVTYQVLVEHGERSRLEKRSASLQELLDQVGGVGEITKTEFRHADPRQLILSTVQEVRQTVGQMADLARMLADARVMERFREALLTEIAREEPEVAGRIAEAVRRSLVLHNAFRGPEALPAGPARDD